MCPVTATAVVLRANNRAKSKDGGVESLKESLSLKELSLLTLEATLMLNFLIRKLNIATLKPLRVGFLILI